MPQHTIPSEKLREGTYVSVSGTIAYSRVRSFIDGSELAKRASDARARGVLYPPDRPHTTIAVVDPQVRYTGPNNTPTPEELWVEESFFAYKQGKYAGQTAYSVDTLGTQLPVILERQADGSAVPVNPDGELANNQSVTLMLQVYKPKNYEKRGIGLRTVCVNGPVKTYGGDGSLAEALAQAGITVVGELKPATAANISLESIEAMNAATEQDQAALPGVYEPDQAPVETEEQRIARMAAEMAAQMVAQQTAQPATPAVGSPWDIL